jgi:hypothetical protein
MFWENLNNKFQIWQQKEKNLFNKSAEMYRKDTIISLPYI